MIYYVTGIMDSHYLQLTNYLVSTRPETPVTAQNFYTRVCIAVGKNVLNEMQVCVVLRLYICKILVRLHESSLKALYFTSRSGPCPGSCKLSLRSNLIKVY